MKKRILSIVLAICLLFTLVPTTVFAADKITPGSTDEFLDLLSGKKSVALDRNYILPYGCEIGKDFTLDLNGYMICLTNKDARLYAGSDDFPGNKTLTIKDSRPSRTHSAEEINALKNGGATNLNLPNGMTGGVVTSTVASQGAAGFLVWQKCTLNLESGTIYSCASTTYGGGVYVYPGSTFNMKGGTIDGCSARIGGGGVYVEKDGAFNMTGGTIKNCKAEGASVQKLGGAVYIEPNATCTMSGGTIQKCTATDGAGGILNKGSFTMSGGTIDNCSAENAGGITNTGTFTMTNGTIKNCSATIDGGGVLTGSAFTMTGGTIKNCTADSDNGFGGGVCIMSSSAANATFTLDGGTIQNCTAKKGGGVGVANRTLLDSTTYFTMKSGTIDNCRAESLGGGVYIFYHCKAEMNSGTIKNCSAEYAGGGVLVNGGAAYNESTGEITPLSGNSNETCKFTMNGGTIQNCKATKNSNSYGGGVAAFYGNFAMNNGTIKDCSASHKESSAVCLHAKATMIADGGSVYGQSLVYGKIDDNVCEITNTSSAKYTKFYGLVENQGTISGGVFYGGIKNTKNKNGVYGNVTNPYKIVTFNLNGATGSVPNQWLVNAKGATANRPTDPTWEGYKFMGWYNGNTVYDFTTAVPDNIKIFTLKAKWVNSRVSTEAELKEAINAGITSIKLIDDITLSNILDLSDKDITLDLNGHILTGDIKLFATFNPTNTSKLTLIDSNPTATHTNSNLPLGGVLDGKITLDKQGLSRFSRLCANGGTVKGQVILDDSNTQIVCTSTTPTAFMDSVGGSGAIHGGIFYGNVKESCIKEKTVTFMNGGKLYAVGVVASGNFAVAPIDPVKDGYVFAGWYFVNTKYNFPLTIPSDITLTAKWVNEVTDEETLRTAINEGITNIKLMADINLSRALDLSNKNITIDLNGYVISGADISINAGNGKANLTLKDSRPTATHTDSTLPKGGVVKSKISMKKDGGSYNDCVLYANGGTVTSDFYTNTHIVSIKCTSNTPTAFTGNISGYVHLYGGIYYGSIASSVTIEAKKITFKNGNNTYAYEVVDTGNKTVTPINPPIKEGYNGFDGWYNGDTKYTFGSTLSEDITLTAKFSNPKTYNISYKLDGGTATNPATYTVESEDITLNNPKKTGYTFTGWSGTGLTGENYMTVTIAKGSKGDRTYTAHFSQNNYTVKFDTNGGSSISDKTGVKWDDTVLTGITNPTKAGCEFIGWKCSNMTVNANTKYSDLAADDTVKSVTLVAQWNDTEKPVITGLENGKTYCGAVEFEVSDNDGIASVKVNNVELTATNGKYTLAKGIDKVTVDVLDKSGNKTSVTVTVNNGHTAGNDDGDCSTPVYCIYHPNTIVVKEKSHKFSGELNKDKDGHWYVCQNDGCAVADTKVPHSGTDDGDCTTAVVCECGYIITVANAKHSYGAWQSKGNNTHTRYCTVTGCKGSETKDCTGGQATYFKKAVCKDCNKPYGSLLTDLTAPTGEITIGTNKWNSFLNTITFGLFFKDTQSVAITANDDSYNHNGYTDDKAVKVEYLLSDKGLNKTDLAGKEFTEYGSAFNINPDNKYVVYVKLTDHAGNVTYISSNGVVLDATAPVISGIENSKTYCEAQTVTVTEKYIKSVTVNGTEVSLDANNQFTLNPKNGTQTVVVTDKAGNETAVNVTVNNGHTAGNDDGDCSTPVYCIYHPNTIVVKEKSHKFSGELNKDKDGHWYVCQNDGCTVPETKASHSGTDDGDCTTAVICECGYIITAAKSQHSYGAWQSKGNNTHTRYCTVTGCKGSETKNCSGGTATYFKKAVCDYCKEEYGELLTDLTAPTGEITIGTNKWNSFLNTITFGLFFKNTQSVTITATDDSYNHNGYTDDKAVKVEYLLSDKGLSKTDLADKEFTEYGSAFNINPDNKYVVYVKLTDHAGNVTYISSNGVVLDATAPVISGIENGKTYCEAQTVTVTEKYIKSVTVNGTEVPLDANNQFTLNPKNGTQTVVVTDKAGNETAVTVTVNNGHTAGNDDGNCSTPVYCIYHPTTVVVAAKSHNFSGKWNNDENGHWHICQNDGCTVPETKASHSGTDDGDCTTAVICECGYIITAAKSQHSYGAWQSNGDGTHTRYCTVTGCNISEDGDCTGGKATYFKKAVCEECNETYGSLLTDLTAPTGEITVGTNKWNSFLNTITFGLFFKDTQSVTITATDDSYNHNGYTDDKAVKVEYLLSDKGLSKTDLAGKEFTEYGSAFNINPDNKYVVYVKLTDHAGNVTYISSNGIVLDATAPAITGVTDGAVYYTTQKAVVTDDNLEAVTLNGVSVDGTTVTLDGNTDEVYTIVATDKSGNSKTVTVTMKPISNLSKPIDDINGENVNSSDKEAIEAVKESVGEVDISNATDSEKEALNDINDRCDELLDIIDKAQKATETENIKNVEGINPDNVTKNDREALEKAKADLEKALEEYGSNYTDDEKAKIQSDLERVNKSLKVLDDVKAVEDSIASLPDTFKPDDLDTVQKIQDAKKSYDALTDYEKSLVSKDTKAKLDKLTKGITAYAFYEGSGGIWTIGQEGTLTFTANGAYSKFTGIKVDGKDVDHSNYTAKSGSTIISLNAGYLNTLSVGTHTLTVLYTDGEAEMDFEVKAIKKDTEETTMPKEPVSTEEITVPKESADATKTTKLNKNTSKKSPETGNDSETALLLAFLLSCGGVIVVTGAYGKRKKHI